MCRAVLSRDFSNKKMEYQRILLGRGGGQLDWDPVLWMGYPGYNQSTMADRGM